MGAAAEPMLPVKLTIPAPALPILTLPLPATTATTSLAKVLPPSRFNRWLRSLKEIQNWDDLPLSSFPPPEDVPSRDLSAALSEDDRNILFTLWSNRTKNRTAATVSRSAASYTAANEKEQMDFWAWAADLADWAGNDVFDFERSHLEILLWERPQSGSVLLFAPDGECVLIGLGTKSIAYGRWSIRSKVILHSATMIGNQQWDDYIVSWAKPYLKDPPPGMMVDCTRPEDALIYFHEQVSASSHLLGVKADEIATAAGIMWKDGRIERRMTH